MRSFALLAVLLVALTASASEIQDPTPRQRELAFRVAQVAANEGAFFYRSTVALVWQVVRENGGDTLDDMSDFLARHSPRVHGLKRCFGGNCVWSKNLVRGDAQPLGLVMRADQWQLRVAPMWIDTQIYADYLVGGMRSDEDPCPIRPRTWGGPMDRVGAIARGLYPIGCFGGSSCRRDTCNDGYTFYNACWKDGFWACDPEFEPLVQSVEPAEVLWSSL